MDSGHYLTYLFFAGKQRTTLRYDQEVNYLNFDKLTLRNKSTFRSETHTIRSDYIKGKQEQCRGKFKNAFMDVRQVNYIDKIYLGLFTFPTKLFSDQD